MIHSKNLGLLLALVALLSGGATTGDTLAQAGDGVNSRDTIFGDRFPGVVRVQDVPKTGSGRPAVPMVDLDTNVYEKRLWLSEKKQISYPEKSKKAKIVAKDSIVYVAYWHWATLMVTYSTDCGATWVLPDTVHYAGLGYSHGSPITTENTILVPYSSSFPPASEIIARRSPLVSLNTSDSVVIESEETQDQNLMCPTFAYHNDTAYVSYYYRTGDDRTIGVERSINDGVSWEACEGTIEPGAGTPEALLATDTVLSVLHQPDLEVLFNRSFDRGEQWAADLQLSSSEAASQQPAASTDDVSGIHVVWYDFEDLPPEATGGWVYYRRSLDAGGSWDDIHCLSTTASSESVEIWADTIRTYACWSDARYGSPNLALYLRYSHDGGSTWSPEIKMVDELDPAWEPDVYAQGDLVYIVWQEQHPPDWVWEIQYILGAWYLPGDVDLSEEIDIADLVYMVDWMFSGGPAPIAYDAAQMDGLGEVDISDLVYIVDYMFNDGPPPVGGEGL